MARLEGCLALIRRVTRLGVVVPGRTVDRHMDRVRSCTRQVTVREHSAEATMTTLHLISRAIDRAPGVDARVLAVICSPRAVHRP